MDRGKWEMRGEVRKWTDVPLQAKATRLPADQSVEDKSDESDGGMVDKLSYQEGAELCEKLERSCVIHSDAEGVSVLELQKQLRRMRGHFHCLEFASRKQSTLDNFFTSGSHDSDMLD
jgi:hypothetical protein